MSDQHTILSKEYSIVEQPTTKSITILAVDDDSSLLELIKTFLERENDNFCVTTRTRPDEALSELTDGDLDVDVVVSDYDMPSMNGVEFLEGVRSEFSELPFILFTGKGSEEVASDAISAGVTDYLQKETGTSQYSVLANRIENVVEKHRANKRLKQSEKRFSKLVENSTDLISIVSEDGQFKYVSPSAEHIIGHTQEEMTGEPLFNYVHPDDRKEVMETFFEAVENPEMSPTIEFRLNNPKSEEVVIESRGTNLLDDNTVDGFVVNSRDITPLKHREQDLKQRNEQLNHIKDLLSKDIQNPLNVALGSIELYEETGEEANLEKAKKSLHRIGRLIKQANYLADQQLEVQSVEQASLEDVVWSAWDAVEHEDVILQIENSRQIEADTDSLRLLFENLMVNAAKHSGKDTTCTVGTFDDGIYFADDGPGIPEGDRELVFEPGYTTAEDHTGLGLTIVKRIVEKHGWSISITESKDGGTRFEITGVAFHPTVYE